MNSFDYQSNSQLDLYYPPQIQAKTVNGILYFTVDRGLDDPQSWKTDGTAEGTVFVGKKIPYPN